MRIIIPKRVASITGPLFFLAGPIRGGGDWQQRMCLLIEERAPGCTIVNPCRWTDAHPLATHFVGDEGTSFANQTAWERAFLTRAGTGPTPGCIVFWLGLESASSPHPGPEPYAMDTRGELGEWRWRMRTENARVVVGAEPGFLGLKQIRRNFDAALGRELVVAETLETTADAAVAMSARR